MFCEFQIISMNIETKNFFLMAILFKLCLFHHWAKENHMLIFNL